MTRDEIYRIVPFSYLEDPGKSMWVYVIKCGEFVKIGLANDVARRLREMNLMNPHRCTVSMKAEVARCLALKVEKHLHVAFREHKHRREWFRLAPRDVKQEFWRAIEIARQVEARYDEHIEAYLSERRSAGTDKDRAREYLVKQYSIQSSKSQRDQADARAN